MTQSTSPRLLILGGTRFIGPHIVEEAKRRGYTVTLFNRGKSNPDLFTDVEQLRGDRDASQLEALEGRTWDAVVDTSAYYPRVVREALDVLDDRIDHYVFISTISVYEDFGTFGLDEDSPLETLEDPTTEDVSGATYGGLKVLCEEAAREHGPEALTVIRPGVVAGPRDHTDRFTYWPVRAARGGEMLVPGDGDDPVQYIDARDLAAWVLDTVDDQITGTYNAVVPRDSVTVRDLVEASQEAADDPAEPIFVDESFLLERDAAGDFPMWTPRSGKAAGVYSVSAERAHKAGMKTRPVTQTAADTLEWFQSLPDERRADLEAGPSPQREEALLRDWNVR